MAGFVIHMSPDWAAELREPWRELADADPLATPFQSWEWQSLWFKHFGARKRPRVWTQWEGGQLIGLYPMVEVASPWRALRPMGCGPSDYLQPLARPGFERDVAEGTADFLRSEASNRLVDLQQLRETLPLAEALKREVRVFDQAMCLVLDLPASYDAYLKSLGKSLRYDVKRLEKSPFADGRAKIEPVGTENAAEGVDFFFEAHKKRWSKRGLPGAFMGSRIRDFHREWASVAAENGWLWMSLLTLDGVRIGAIYAMRFGKTCFFYQSGFDPAFSALSPGSLLVAQTIRRAIEEGLERFDFLRGDEPYKRRWKPQHAYANQRILMGSDSALAKLGAKWNERAFAVEAKVRARFEGRGLRG